VLMPMSMSLAAKKWPVLKEERIMRAETKDRKSTNRTRRTTDSPIR